MAALVTQKQGVPSGKTLLTIVDAAGGYLEEAKLRFD